MVARGMQKVEQQLADFIIIWRDFPLLLLWLFARRYCHTQSRLQQVFKVDLYTSKKVLVFSLILIKHESLHRFKLATCA